MSNTRKKLFFFKILIVGDGGVGKTTLLHRYKNDEFSSNTEMTIGVEFYAKDVSLEKYNIKIQLWDFGGQEQFRHLLENYAMGASGAILLYDSSRVATLENLEEWVNISRSSNPELPIILIGTKSDLQGEIIGDDLVADVLKTFNIFAHVKVSSKTGENVSLVLDKMAKEIVLKILEKKRLEAEKE